MSYRALRKCPISIALALLLFCTACAEKKVVKIGDAAPAFSGHDLQGNPISLAPDEGQGRGDLFLDRLVLRRQFETAGTLLQPEKAWWVGDPGGADSFMKEHGGTITTFEASMKAACEDMYRTPG